MNKIDWNKPLQNKNGHKCKCVYDSVKDKYNRVIVANAEECEYIYLADDEGFPDSGEDGEMIINIFEKKECWVNIYPNGIAIGDPNKENSIKNKGDDSIGTWHITFSEDKAIKPTIEWVEK